MLNSRSCTLHRIQGAKCVQSSFRLPFSRHLTIRYVPARDPTISPKITSANTREGNDDRKAKRREHWKRAIRKSRKDRLAYERLAVEKEPQNGRLNSVSISTVGWPRTLTWRTLKKRRLAADHGRPTNYIMLQKTKALYSQISQTRKQRTRHRRKTRLLLPRKVEYLRFRRPSLLQVRKIERVRVRKSRPLLIRPNLDQPALEKRDFKPVLVDATTEKAQWQPHFQRRIHRLRNLADSFKLFTQALEQQNGSVRSGTDIKKQTSSHAPLSPSLSRPDSNHTKAHISPGRRMPSRVVQMSQRAKMATMAIPLVRRISVGAGTLPVSPLEKRMDLVSQRTTKRQPTYAEKERLATNPWAVMLASSIRHDTASRIRLPEDLLVDFGMVTNPADEKAYMMPDELADLDAFVNRLQTPKRRFTKAWLVKDSKGSRARVTPYKLLLDDLTDSFQVWDQPTKTARTKSSSIMKRMISPRWLGANAKLLAYQKASKDYWTLKEKLGELDNDLFQKPETPFDLNDLHWQAAISERMPNMMRQRILISLNNVGHLRSAQSSDRQSQLQTCFEWPNACCLALGDLELRATDNIGNKDFWNDMGDIESGGAIEGTSSRQGNSKDPRPPIAVLPSEISEELPSRPTSTSGHVPNWIPGSVFLHVGPPAAAVRALPYLKIGPAATQYSTDPLSAEILANSKYIPPMITIAPGYRLPVFNLQAMFGQDFAKVLTKVLQTHSKSLLDRMSVDKIANLDEMNHVILLRSDTGVNRFAGQMTLAHELWQLWRYLGGRDCLLEAIGNPINGESPQSDTSKADVAKTRAGDRRSVKARLHRNASDYRGLSPTAWNRLYELLGLEAETS